MTFSFRTLRALCGAALGVVMLLGVMVGLTPAFAQDSEPQFLVVHEVDARENPVELTVLSGSYNVDRDDVVLTAEGESVSATSVRSAIENGDAVEIVFVLEANAKLSRADQFEKTKEQVATLIERLPAGVSVGVVAAGSRDQIQAEMSSDLDAVARSVRAMNPSNGSAVLNGMRRGADLFSDEAETHRTMIVTSAFSDELSVTTPIAVRSELVRRNVQVLGALYQGDAGGVIGERRLGSMANVTGGALFDATNSTEFESAINLAVGIGSDRLIVAYDGQVELTERGDLTMQIGSTSVSISYGGGRLTDKPLSLTPVLDPEPSPLDFLRSGTGLAITIGLTAVGMLAAVWSLGNIFAGGESTLEGMLRRYSGEEGEALDEEETAIVQTALVKKAVELTESFAEDRGFLARVEEILEQARLPLRAGEAMGIFGMATVAGFGLGFVFTGSVIRGLVVAAVAGFALSSGVQFKARKRVKKFEAQLPDMLQLLAGTLRAGYSLPQGLEAVSHEISEPMGYELTRAMTEARLGREIEEALGGIAERLDSPDFAWAVMAISIQREVGGNLNELLMTVSDTMVARERLAGEVRALTAEGKLSAAILGGLPPLLGFVMWIMNPSYIEGLFTKGLGQIMLVAGVISGGIGLAWMRKVITINV